VLAGATTTSCCSRRPHRPAPVFAAAAAGAARPPSPALGGSTLNWALRRRPAVAVANLRHRSIISPEAVRWSPLHRSVFREMPAAKPGCWRVVCEVADQQDRWAASPDVLDRITTGAGSEVHAGDGRGPFPQTAVHHLATRSRCRLSRRTAAYLFLTESCRRENPPAARSLCTDDPGLPAWCGWVARHWPTKRQTGALKGTD
jgi:hypothetical protein